MNLESAFLTILFTRWRAQRDKLSPGNQASLRASTKWRGVTTTVFRPRGPTQHGGDSNLWRPREGLAGKTTPISRQIVWTKAVDQKKAGQRRCLWAANLWWALEDLNFRPLPCQSAHMRHSRRAHSCQDVPNVLVRDQITNPHSIISSQELQGLRALRVHPRVH